MGEERRREGRSDCGVGEDVEWRIRGRIDDERSGEQSISVVFGALASVFGAPVSSFSRASVVYRECNHRRVWRNRRYMRWVQCGIVARRRGWESTGENEG